MIAASAMPLFRFAMYAMLLFSYALMFRFFATPLLLLIKIWRHCCLRRLAAAFVDAFAYFDAAKRYATLLFMMPCRRRLFSLPHTLLMPTLIYAALRFASYAERCCCYGFYY